MRLSKLIPGLFMMMTAFLLNTFLVSAFAHTVDLGSIIEDPAVEKAVVVATGVGASFVTGGGVGALNAGVAKELWLTMIKEGFYPKDSFIARSVDLSAFVENSVLHAAEAGVDPVVLIDNTTFPIAINQQTDTSLDIPLSTYDTENTKVLNVEEMESAYDKMKVVTGKHQKALRKMVVRKAAHGWTPSSDAAFTPVEQATGAAFGGLARLKIADIIQLGKRFDEVDIDQEGRVLVLCPQHKADILLEDVSLNKSFTNLKKGEVMQIAGFDIYWTSVTPTFNKTTGVKVAFGAAAAPATDTHSSFAFHEDEVFLAEGEDKMFYEEASPTLRADIVGFQKRAITLPVRSKGIGAIYSPVA